MYEFTYIFSEQLSLVMGGQVLILHMRLALNMRYISSLMYLKMENKGSLCTGLLRLLDVVLARKKSLTTIGRYNSVTLIMTTDSLSTSL